MVRSGRIFTHSATNDFAAIAAIAAGLRQSCNGAAALARENQARKMPRGARPVQAFATVRKCPEFCFQAQVLLAGFG
jgi:hypothetical protein